MADYMQDLDDVRAVVQLYVEGSNGNGDSLRQAFSSGATMAGHIGAMDTYIPIGDFIAMVEAGPGMAGPNYQATIRSIDLTGDAGVAV